MNKMIAYLESAIQGVDRYFEANKLIVLLFALFFAWWLTGKKPEDTKGRTLLLYTLIMTLLLLFPVTAMFVMIYQTAYYDYEWAWSMVPLTVVIAYGAVIFIEKSAKKGRILLGVLGVVAVLCLCGNQGTPLTVESEEASAQENTAIVLQEIYDFGMTGQRVLWAPKKIMEQVRRLDGKILLIYGRDMWDTKAGAYDYEAYSPQLTNAYIWLEVMNSQAEIAAVMTNPIEDFKTLCDREDLNRTREEHLNTVIQAGVNVLVLPNLVAEHIEESVVGLAAEKQLSVQSAYTEEYTIYLLE